jgi:hypothetical protein
MKKKEETKVNTMENNYEEQPENKVTDSSKEPRVYKIKSREEIKKERQEHLNAIRKKYSELIEKGISPRSLMTKENMEKWLKSGMSYQRIAREEVGISELEVSRIAKEYGLISIIGDIVRRKYARY